MRPFSRALSIGAVLFAMTGAAAAAPDAPRVLRPPRPEAPLAERFAWAAGEAGRAFGKDGGWIGYGVRRLGGERSFFGGFRGGSRWGRPTLEDLVSPRATPLSEAEVMRKAVEDALARSDPNRPAERLVPKNTALLMRFEPTAADLPAAVNIHDLDLPFEPEGPTLIWLGPAGDDESVRFLESLYGRASDPRLKEDALDALGLHRSPDLILPFLEPILRSSERDSLRESAASILGEQRDERAVAILKRTARTDESVEVRCAAVRALAEARLDSADEAVIDIASNAGLRRLREAAVEALAEVAVRKALPMLKRLLRDDPDLEVRESVVETLAELPDGEGLPLLIETARRHPDPAVRKAAIRALGESGDPRALDALVALVRGGS